MHFFIEGLDINDNGNLQFDGCDLKQIADEFGTPAYVMNETAIRKNCRAYKDSIDNYYDGNGLALYASKALSCKYLYKIVNEEGLGVDVVSGGELYTALKAGFPVNKIYFHGNNKSEDELRFALESKVGRIVVDNFYELELINSIAKEMNISANVMFRIKPGVDAHTHDFIKTGQIDSKFGFALENGEADEVVKRAISLSNINIIGFHCHIGSQIFDLSPFEHTAEIMMHFIADVKKKYGFEAEELNLGGGFGCKYVDTDTPINYGEYIKAVSKVVKRCADELGIRLPFILVEPGRSIVAEAGLTLYKVGSVKEIPGIRTYVSVDGGMADNPRYILYQAEYTAISVENPTAKSDQTITLAGKSCESGDLIGENIKLSKVKPGEIIAVLTTGAYNYSMASNYNRMLRPPIIMIKDGIPSIAVKRETYEDLIRNDL